MIKSKLPNVGISIFTSISKLANESKSLNLAQGFPNFSVDKNLVNIIKSVSQKDVHQYCPMQGNEMLRFEIKKLIKKTYKRNLETENILITAGATQGIFTCIQALVKENDEVVILDPSYDCYETPVLLCGAKSIRIPLDINYSPNWNQISDSINEKTRMLIINNPHNPSGKTWKKEDFNSLVTLLKKYPNLLVLSDEVYEFITYEKNHLSIHSFPMLHERCISVSSFGKTLHITGWKIGYLIAPKHLMSEIIKVHQYLVFCVNSLSQHVLLQFLPSFDAKKIRSLYQQKKDLFLSNLKKSRFQILPCEGSYFQSVSYNEISNKKDTEFVHDLIIKHKVAAIPFSVFNKDGKDNKTIRFCFAKDDQTLIKASKILCKI